MSLIGPELEWIDSLTPAEFEKHCRHPEDLPVKKRVVVLLFKRLCSELRDDSKRSLPALAAAGDILFGNRAQAGQNNINLPNITPEQIMAAMMPPQPALPAPVEAKTLPKRTKTAQNPSSFHEHEP